MKKRGWIIIAIIAAAVAVFFAAIALDTDVKTEIVQSGTMEVVTQASGTIVRHETLLTSNYGGNVDRVIQEGERVSNGMLVASVYKEQIDREAQKKLQAVNERIREVTENRADMQIFASDLTALDNRMKAEVDKVIQGAMLGGGTDFSGAKDEINKLLDRRKIISGDEGTASTHLESLYAEKASYEGKLGSAKSEVYAPEAGVISYEADGLEDILKADKIGEYTVSDVETWPEVIQNSRKETPGVIGKIADNFIWYYVYLDSEQNAEDLSVGRRVDVRFKVDDVPTLRGEIAALSEPENGKVAVSVALTESTDIWLKYRTVEADVITDSYSGLKIPVSALRYRDGTTGVYILRDRVPRFRSVEVLYKNDQYAVVKEDNTVSDSLRLYDALIVSDGEVEEGQLL